MSLLNWQNVYIYVETLQALICSKFTIKTAERRHSHRSGIFSVNFQANCSNLFIVNFEQLDLYVFTS